VWLSKPLKDKQLLPAVAESQDQVALGEMCPDDEFASSNLRWRSQRLEIQIRATGVGAGLPSSGPPDGTTRNHDGHKQLGCGNVRRCGPQSRSPLAHSTHVVAGVEHKEMRCLT
jgi:hypothetical protein